MNLPEDKLPPPPKYAEGDFRASLHWEVLRIMSEFVNGWQFLADFKKSVTFFGSARFTEDSPWYKEAYKLGKLLAETGFFVTTGGGPGIMEAGNRGAMEHNGGSVGLLIKLPEGVRANPYIKQNAAFHYFFIRKVMLAYAAQAYVYFPGGFGTLDEFFEIVVLIQTKKISSTIPVICVGKEFWNPLISWIDTMLYEKLGALDSEDRDIYSVVDSAEEAFEIIKKSSARPRDEVFFR